MEVEQCGPGHRVLPTGNYDLLMSVIGCKCCLRPPGDGWRGSNSHCSVTPRDSVTAWLSLSISPVTCHESHQPLHCGQVRGQDSTLPWINWPKIFQTHILNYNCNGHLDLTSQYKMQIYYVFVQIHWILWIQSFSLSPAKLWRMWRVISRIGAAI